MKGPPASWVGARSPQQGAWEHSPVPPHRPQGTPTQWPAEGPPSRGAVGRSEELLLPRNPRAARRLVSVTATAAGGQTTGVHGRPTGRATRRPTPRSSGCQTGSLQCGEQGHPRHPESKNKPGDATAGTSFLPGPKASGSDLTSCRDPQDGNHPPPHKALPLTPPPPDAPLFTLDVKQW